MPSRRKWILRSLIIALPGFVVLGWFVAIQIHELLLDVRSNNNLEQLGRAMLFYEDQHGHLPRANSHATRPEGGETKHPVSWRVLILPYIEQQALFDQYWFSEPWDSANNIRLIDRMPKIYRHPKADRAGVPSGYTHYRVFASPAGAKPSALFTDGMPGPKLREVPDGPSNTMLIVEAEEAVPWTMPEVLMYGSNQPLPKLGGLFKGKFHVATASGSVYSFRSDMPEDRLRAWITKDGGEPME